MGPAPKNVSDVEKMEDVLKTAVSVASEQAYDIWKSLASTERIK